MVEGFKEIDMLCLMGICSRSFVGFVGTQPVTLIPTSARLLLSRIFLVVG